MTRVFLRGYTEICPGPSTDRGATRGRARRRVTSRGQRAQLRIFHRGGAAIGPRGTGGSGWGRTGRKDGRRGRRGEGACNGQKIARMDSPTICETSLILPSLGRCRGRIVTGFHWFIDLFQGTRGERNKRTGLPTECQASPPPPTHPPPRLRPQDFRPPFPLRPRASRSQPRHQQTSLSLNRIEEQQRSPPSPWRPLPEDLVARSSRGYDAVTVHQGTRTDPSLSLSRRGRVCRSRCNDKVRVAVQSTRCP